MNKKPEQKYGEDSENVFTFADIPKEYQDQIMMLILSSLISVIRTRKVLMKFAMTKHKAAPRLIENMSVREIFQLLSLPEACESMLKLNLDLDMLMPYLEKAKTEEAQKSREADDITWLLENGATKTLILNTFPHMESKHLDMWIKVVFKEKMNPYDKIGRNKTISNQKTVQLVLDKWHEVNKRQLSGIDVLKEIKASFPEHSLAVLMATINTNWSLDN